ncbi:DUF971 domain-containing protein [Bradyrhizobium sp. U87765 SZCCT0131]|nr:MULTISPECIES: DUF971 domain-containing protein [unclassified Bradyrhizobium]MBR1218980.1 DUF971 domain-containing protein [Bradyrhizobium sp. U87765 SZCCT0131]MBR1261631.1 DUF971 domain-containing protein [Bradyrhizobium sp. U87765 SZCCT0134]MBR1306516.1 DUF971 domain-containing protein [Bradyrhizobium sp. U87765 SZCCT0110]MBR1317413.1 DUF971 domain-containing protein [Bradyrhizobium sp. U87765 SZCCT0109]MBR1351115.1 DUF971 domain-containing protein [Bradyrhizobium sp. U87765 SZCCT0048]
MEPSDITLDDPGTTLVLTWPDGTGRLDAQALRRASRAASEIRRQAEGIELHLPEDLRVELAEPIGNYALRLVFSDGHNRGIYPWSYLRALAGLEAA